MRDNIEHVRRWAHILCVPRHEAEEILQRALIELWRNHARIEASCWPAWLWKAAIFRKWGNLRAWRARRAAEPGIAVSLELAHAGRRSPEDELCDRETERELLWLIEQVHESRREVARRSLLREEPLKEIARSLGLPEGTVKSRMLLAREEMRAAFKRRHARERTMAWLALVRRWPALVAALLLALWHRFASRARRQPAALFACAACASLAIRGTVVVALAASPGPEIVESTPDELVARAEVSFELHRSTWAERERDAVPAASVTPSASPARIVAAAPPSAHAAHAMARGLLGRATAALQAGQIEHARTALRDYDRGFPHNPFPGHRAEVAAALPASPTRPALAASSVPESP